MTVIKIGGENLPEPDVVELFDHKFTVRRLTRSVQKALEKVDKEIRAAEEEDDSDKIVAFLASGIDALLAPNGSGVHAKTVLTKAWKDDLLSFDQITALSEQLQESAARRPPTSPAGT